MKQKLTNNLVFKILSVIFAIAIWLVVINVDDPTKTVTIRGIEVQVLNDDAITSKDQVYEIVSGRTATLSVTGPRSIVDSLSASDFVATADFSEISQTNAIPITIDLAESNTRYENRLTIVQNTYSMRVNIEAVISKEFAIEPVYNGEVAEGHELGNAQLSHTSVTIKAAESVIASIETVRAAVDVSGLSTDLDAAAVLTFYNAAGQQINLTTNQAELSVNTINVKATMYIIKEIPVTYTLRGDGAEGSAIASSALNFTQIKVRGTRDVIDTISELVIPEELLDVTDITEATDFRINVADLLPAGIYTCTGYETVIVSVVTEQIVTRNFSISLEDVMIRKIPDGHEASVVDSGEVTITLRGQSSLFLDFDATTLVPYLDLTNAVEGENSVALHVTLPDGIEMTRVVTILVNVTNKESNTTTTEETTTTAPVEVET